jgi:hypothetical protein
MSSTRRDVLRNATLFGGSLLFSRVLAACAVDSSAATGADGEETLSQTEDALVTCKPPVISANHGHQLTVPAADVTAQVAKTYSIKGASGHDHLVTITAAQFAQLGAGQAVTVASTNSAGHTHSVTVRCTVSAPPPPGSSPQPQTAACSRGASGTAISANHGHSLTVPKADVAAAATKTYSIQGTSSHAHQVTITAAQFGQLKSGRSISVTSSLALSHAHTVTVACA